MVHAPDGSPVELYPLVPPAGEAQVVHAATTGPSTVLELGCGTGRILRPLATLGHRVTGVDESPEMLAHLGDLPHHRGRIEDLTLGRTFDVVLLASHLLNTADPVRRAAFLATAARHVAASGAVIVQWQPPEWFDRVAGGRSERDGVGYHLHSLRRDGTVLHAVIDYRAGGREFRHTFTTRRIELPDLSAALADAGLWLDRWLTPDRAWFCARSVSPPG